MIENITFENVQGPSLVFNSNTTPFNEWNTEVEMDGQGDKKARQHGVWPYMIYFGARIFRGEGDIIRTTAGEYIQTRKDLFSALRPSPHLGNRVVGRLRITYTGMEELEAWCTLDGYPELPMQGLGPAHGSYMIAFKAFDPRLYSVSEYTAQADITAAPAGFTFPFTFPLSFAGAGSSGGDLTLTNSGNIETEPKVDVYGPVTGPQFILTRGGVNHFVALDELNINTGQVLTVDFATPSASLDGVSVNSEITQRDWWALEPGNNDVTFTAYSAAAPSHAIFRWKNAYMI